MGLDGLDGPDDVAWGGLGRMAWPKRRSALVWRAGERGMDGRISRMTWHCIRAHLESGKGLELEMGWMAVG
jgi:hypothetical protein